MTTGSEATIGAELRAYWAYRLAVFSARGILICLPTAVIPAVIAVQTQSLIAMIIMLVGVGFGVVGWFTGMVAWYPANRWAVRHLASSAGGRKFFRRFGSLQKILYKDIFMWRRQ